MVEKFKKLDGKVCLG